MGGDQHKVSTVKEYLEFNFFWLSFHEVLDKWNRSYMIKISVFCIYIWVVIPDEKESPVV